MLRVLLVATILLPLILGAVAAYLSYLSSVQRATRSASEAVAVATENTAKVLDTHLLVAARIDDVLGTLTDAQIQSSEKQLHDRIAQQIAGLPEVAAAWVIDAAGHELVSAKVFPVNRDRDQSSREDFTAFRQSDARAFIWMLRARSLDTGDYQPYFTVSLRRVDADGHFSGIVVVAISGSYFASFYNSLLGGSEHYSANVLRDDGAVLARFPAPANTSDPPRPDPLLATAIANATQSEIAESGTPFDGAGRLVAIKRVGNYPVYVTIERTKASIVQDWLRSVAGYTMIGIPAAIALIGLSLLALRQTRREQFAQAQANEAFARHAAVEVALHQAQRMEAVGLLTAGIAHDFNNFLTVVLGNVERLEASLEGSDARRLKPLAAAKEACARAAALSRRLLGFARQEPVDPRPIDVNEVIVSTLELPWQSGDRIAAEFRLHDKLWPVSVDPNQLATALLNLALNARDAMPKGGRLTVETGNFSLNDAATVEAAGVSLGDYVRILVRDTGQGMSPEIREKALDPFFTTKEPGKGTGLGLALVNGFVTRSGGYCTIDSEPGRGTTVAIHLPRHIEAGPADDGEPVDAAKPNRPRRRRAEAEADRARPD